MSKVTPGNLPVGMQSGAAKAQRVVNQETCLYTQGTHSPLKECGKQLDCSVPQFTLLLEAQLDFTAIDVHVGTWQHYMKGKGYF